MHETTDSDDQIKELSPCQGSHAILFFFSLTAACFSGRVSEAKVFCTLYPSNEEDCALGH